MSLRVRPVACAISIMYGVLSPFLLIFMLLSKADYLRIPFGIVAPLVYLNINFDLQRPEHFLTGALFMVFGVACYIATGWLTGAAAVLFFNFIARRIGGIEATVLTRDSVRVEPVVQ